MRLSQKIRRWEEEVYVNTSATADGAMGWQTILLQVALAEPIQDSYLLEKMELYKSDVELVEVEK